MDGDPIGLNQVDQDMVDNAGKKIKAVRDMGVRYTNRWPQWESNPAIRLP